MLLLHTLCPDVPLNSQQRYLKYSRTSGNRQVPTQTLRELSTHPKIPEFSNGCKWHGNFLGKFLENLKIVAFPKCQPLNWKFRNFREETQIEWKFSVRNFWKFRSTLRGSRLLQKFRKMVGWMKGTLHVPGAAYTNIYPRQTPQSSVKRTLIPLPRVAVMQN